MSARCVWSCCTPYTWPGHCALADARMKLSVEQLTEMPMIEPIPHTSTIPSNPMHSHQWTFLTPRFWDLGPLRLNNLIIRYNVDAFAKEAAAMNRISAAKMLCQRVSLGTIDITRIILLGWLQRHRSSVATQRSVQHHALSPQRSQ
jgi:hypothetical protein